MFSPFSLVIFGATGDLAQRKLIPSFVDLYRQKFLPPNFQIIGFSRREMTTTEFIDFLKDRIDSKPWFNNNLWKDFCQKIVFVSGKFEDEKAYQKIKELQQEYEGKLKRKVNKMLYLATPPIYYETILDNIHKMNLAVCTTGDCWIRILIEKPFGKDLQNAISLDKKLDKLFKEDQIYRIDHYLGKETVQNIIAFRFANGIFEPIWNSEYLDHIQITLSESEGIRTRGNFYEGVGALRDVSQNHLLQLLAMTAMEQPRSFSSDEVRQARYKAVSAIKLIESLDVSKYVVRGQYAGYSQEKNVLPSSNTETFVAMKVFIDTPRFNGVPFYLRAGKRMKKDAVEISLVFKQVCHILFKEVGCPEEGNVLTIRIQPHQGISARFIAKEPGYTMKLTPIDMNFTYKQAFKTEEVDAYDRILQDAFLGDQMLFNRSDELISSWKFITKILEGWEKGYGKLYSYKEGTWGPKEAQELIERDGRKWIV